jgi:hypothetical protein
VDSRRRRLLIRVGLPGGVLVVAAAVVTLVLILSYSPSQAPAADGQLVVHRATDPGEPPIVAAAFAVITAFPQAVTRGDLSSLVEGGPLATAGQAALARTLPAGATLNPDQGTWARTGAGASVIVTVAAPGQAGGRYQVTMMKIGNGWRLWGTLPAGGTG